ncbi:hypothetical protein Hanom_Chr17g01572301 [Helianthus anomalus]
MYISSVSYHHTCVIFHYPTLIRTLEHSIKSENHENRHVDQAITKMIIFILLS